VPARAGHQVAHAAGSAAARSSRSRAAPPPLYPAGVVGGQCGEGERGRRDLCGARERKERRGGDRRWEFAVRAPCFFLFFPLFSLFP